MSRSYRKRPYAPICGGQSQKEDKKRSSRKRRRCTKHRIRIDGDDVLPMTQREALNAWDMAYDGTKRYRPFVPRPDRGWDWNAYCKYVHRK